MLQQTKYFVCVCVCLCARTYLSVCVCVCVGMHWNSNFCKRIFGKTISNVSAYISPIRLRNIPGDLAGVIARVSGWGITSDSKYKFLIILYFNFKNYTYQIDCFKGEETHDNPKKYFWSLWMPSIYSMKWRV